MGAAGLAGEITKLIAEIDQLAIRLRVGQGSASGDGLGRDKAVSHAGGPSQTQKGPLGSVQRHPSGVFARTRPMLATTCPGAH